MKWMEDASDDGDWEPPGRIDGDALIIDCRECRYVPVPGSNECMRCMVSTMCTCGSAARIILRTGKDTEVSGRSGAALRELASLKRWALPSKPDRVRCSKCPMSRRTAVELAWSEFPQPGIQKALSELEGPVPERPGCDECVKQTRRSLEQLGRRMEDLRSRMAVR